MADAITAGDAQQAVRQTTCGETNGTAGQHESSQMNHFNSAQDAKMLLLHVQKLHMLVCKTTGKTYGSHDGTHSNTAGSY